MEAEMARRPLPVNDTPTESESRGSQRVEINAHAEVWLDHGDTAAGDDLAGGWFDGEPDEDAEICAGPGLPAAAADLSLGGVRLRVEEVLRLSKGDPVRMRVSIPGECAPPLDLTGTVQRVDGREAALRFTYLSADSLRRLRGFLDAMAVEDEGENGFRPNYLTLAVPLELD
jgi:hypothetical protein